ncbi:RNA degradosome polyphosphate kinase [Aerococcaceae bacterium DSM 111021]|nr:RNA degradosome polyphosphate kinase [Aerococcaceae bacterium DSM 111021]
MNNENVVDNTIDTLESDNVFENPDYYFNRELSWLDFNRRCIDEAYDKENPLLEQFNFLAIGSSNLDEFVMVRVAGVYDQYLANVKVAENKTQMTPNALLQGISEKNHDNVAAQYYRYNEITPNLKSLNYSIKRMDELNDNELAHAEKYFIDLILPTLSPLGVDAYRPFPHLSNKSLNILVQLEQKKEELTAIVPVPSLLDRYMTIDSGLNRTIILTEDIIIHFIDALFTGYKIKYAYPFRITRNADFDIIEDSAADLLALIEDYVKSRKKGMAVRLEIDTRYIEHYTAEHYDFLQTILELDDRDIYLIDGPLDLTFLFSLADQIGEKHPDQLYKPFKAHLNPNYLGENLYQTASQKDIFLNHPFDSFKPVVSFIEHAAEDKNTIAIKQTLYRVSKNSPIISALKKAAENGKEVTVLVELKARFDEENNVFWARELEEAGCHVLYGVSELKTHSKITLIIRKEDEKIKSYVHLGTGNYNDKTAKTYTDMGIISSNSELTRDASNFFNYLSGYTDRPIYKHLHVSPFEIRDSLIDYINEEIEFQKQNGNGRIIAKMNSLTDKPLIQKLYEASQAGVKVDLIVRGICCLRPGIPGISENIHVRSIVGRFLEHSRIYYFNRNDEKHLFLSSADMMTRNMTKRVEIEFPILDQDIEAEITDILELQLADTMKARVLQYNGDYVRPDRTSIKLNSQIELMKRANAKTTSLQVMQIEKKKKRTNWLTRILRRFNN